MGIISIGVSSRINLPPVANAGADQTIILPITLVNLSGSGTDPDGSIVSYLWTKLSGPSCTITNPNLASTTVTGMSTAGVYTFKLTVTDNDGASASDNMSVTVVALAELDIEVDISDSGSDSFLIQAILGFVVSVNITVTFTSTYKQNTTNFVGPGGSLTILAGSITAIGIFGSYDPGEGDLVSMDILTVMNTPLNPEGRSVNLIFS